MRLLALTLSCLAVLALAAPAGIAAGKRSRTKVVCINNDTFKRQYKVTPRRCIFHMRHQPLAEAFFVRTKHDHWRSWHRRHARGHGRSQPSMGPSTKVRIRLFGTVHKCGHRVFSRAHFTFPELGSSSTMKLDLCA
jgi:hypothetical protein